MNDASIDHPYNGLHTQARSYGIASDYYDVDGGHHLIADEVLRYFVALFTQAEPTTAANEHYFDDVYVLAAADETVLSLPLADAKTISYRLSDEDNRQVLAAQASPVELSLPPLAMGYYTLTVSCDTTGDTGNRNQRQLRYRLIVAPGTAYSPASLSDKQLTGLNVQLYSLRSAHNWGIGDFADLAELIIAAGARGYDFIGINPLHALYPSQPQWCSPYSPSSRRWFNYIYLSLQKVPEFSQNTAAQAWLAEQQPNLQRLRDAELVDYQAVAAIKMQALRLAFAELQTGTSKYLQERRQQFEQFITAGGEALRHDSAFHALNQRLGGLAGCSDSDADGGWLQWSAAFCDIEHPYVQQFMTANSDINFYSYLQWLLAEQLQQLADLCRRHGLELGLYGDLAVGAARGSADVWAQPSLYFTHASIGAPPDPLGPVGQNWQLPPYNPKALKSQGFQPFIELLRANMRYYGALRIDHVMGLYRLWLIPADKTAAEGAYVYYPFEEMMAILALESHNHRCVVIGEDLGTVPNEVRAALNRYRVLSYDVLYFAGQQPMDNSDPTKTGRWRQPHHVKQRALSTLGTHDLPPLRGWWHCRDLDTLGELGVLSGQALQNLYERRLSDKQALLNALKADAFLPADYGGDALSMAMHPRLNNAIHAYAAAGGACLFAVQPENFCATETAFNVPGTTTELPNWQVKLPCPVGDFITAVPHPDELRTQH